MSGVVAVFDRRDDVDRRDVESMVAALRHRGGDGEAVWCEGHAALGAVLLRTLPEDPPTARLFASDDGRYRLAFDGRLDDRATIEARLTGDHRCASDGDVLCAYLMRRGIDGLADIVGDFATVLWDRRRDVVHGACDAMSGRALFVAEVGERVAFASEIRQLLALDWVPRDIDEGRIAEVLTGNPMGLGDTVYRSIKRVHPGTVVSAARRSAGSVRRVLWNLEPDRDVRPIEAMTEVLRETLIDSVRCRLRGVGTVASELSGGLDSSSVTIVASRLLGATGSARVLALTNDYESGDAEERPYVAAALDACDADWQSVPDTGDIFDGDDDAQFSGELPVSVDAHHSRRLGAVARERGAPFLLTGQGGDQVFGGQPSAAIDHLLHGRVRAAASVVMANGRGRQPMATARGVYWSMARPLADWLVPSWPGRRAGRVPYDWIDPAFAARTRLSQRLADAEATQRYRTPWDGARIAAVSSGVVVAQWDAMERVYARVPIESRHPFMDRRLVELCARVAPRHMYDGSDWRPLQRRVAETILPEEIRGRTDKGEFSMLAQRYVADLGGRGFFAGCLPVELGWVRRDVVVEHCTAFQAAPSYPPFGASLLAIAGLHQWLSAQRAETFIQ